MPPPYSAVQPSARPSSGRPWLIALAIVLAIPSVGAVLLLGFFTWRTIASSAQTPAAAPSATTALPSVETPTTASAPATATVVPGKVLRPPSPTPSAPGPLVTPTPVSPSPSPAPTVTVRGGGDTPFVPREFPREQADRRFDQALATIQNCHAPGDPTGTTVVDLTFEGDGRVGTAIHPPFANTQTGECISARLLGLRNSAGHFVNGPVTLHRTVTIR